MIWVGATTAPYDGMGGAAHMVVVDEIEQPPPPAPSRARRFGRAVWALVLKTMGAP